MRVTFQFTIEADPTEMSYLELGSFEIPLPTFTVNWNDITQRERATNTPKMIEDKSCSSKNANATMKIKILFLAANPKNTAPLRLDEEVRSIDEALRLAEFRDRFDLIQHWAVRIADVPELLLRHRPDIVHFSGHGSSRSEIILESPTGIARAVSVRALSNLFKVIKDNVKCVLLNACYSERQAKAISQHIDCVIGMKKAIGDRAAIKFAAGFYLALGYGRDVKTAFELGCVQIDLEGLEEQNTPKLLAGQNNSESIVFISP